MAFNNIIDGTAQFLGVGRSSLGFALFILVVFQAVPAILAATTRADDWSENPSPSQPGSAAFATVWPLLYLAIGAALFFVATSPPSIARTALLVLLVVGVALNWAWIPTWGQGHRKAATYLIVAMLAALFPTLLVAAGGPAKQRVAAACLGPYAAWLLFALVLSSEHNAMDAGL